MKIRTKRKPRTKVYVKIIPENNEIVYSGIEFAEFVEHLYQPIENLMRITGGSDTILFETGFERGLELFEGREQIQNLTKGNVYNFENFCFVDFASSSRLKELSETQIAELLYLGHMFKPLHSPFFEVLGNRFAYLAHDDGWYCKLYCRDLLDFVPVLSGKIKSAVQRILIDTVVDIPPSLAEELLQIASEGIFIDFEELAKKNGNVDVKLYSVGEYPDMDKIFNDCKKAKQNASRTHTLRYCEETWSIM